MNADLSYYIELFLDEIATKKSANSLKAYRSDLSLLAGFYANLADLNNIINLKNINMTWFEQYSYATYLRKLSSLREFLAFTFRKGYIKQYIIDQIDQYENTKASRKKIKDIDRDFLEQVCNKPANSREKAILWFFYSTGITVPELFRYGYFRNLNLVSAEFYIGERTVFLCDQARDCLSKYIQSLSEKTPPALDDFLFLLDGRIPSENYFYQLYKQYASEVGIRSSLKDLRVSLILRLIEVDAQPEDIVNILGLENARPLEKYFLNK